MVISTAMLAALLPYIPVELGLVEIGWPVFAVSIALFLMSAGFIGLNVWQANMRLVRRRDNFLRSKGLIFDWSLLQNSAAWRVSFSGDPTPRDFMSDPNVLRNAQNRIA
ncbi:hypothetical protein [Aurantiacibacter spongiae]|uniref:Uncharacterized protein n=1 Tax=Aurantiacibacter spongiae TaxID=2488860 RepID=A0A3N5DA31_9SPHN|nr:hypothetical protein [Aurantiacibacter spongiae]RPF71508.1 hypothetical protein EG799_07685 [Aurantiacibacter spongiae]